MSDEDCATQSGHEERNRFRAESVNPDAYDSYVKGKYFWNKFTLESVNKSRDFFNRALEKDPTYAPAHVGLAESQINLMFAYSIVAPADGCKKAEGESVRALGRTTAPKSFSSSGAVIFVTSMAA